jgi:predicted 3-demethylubiquinone-9 3-methyltransferase (glyoxalase superfamily)
MPPITPCLWFDSQALEAAEHYVAIFPNSAIRTVSRYTEAGPGEPGSPMVVEFTLDGEPYMGLNGGPLFSFSEAISFTVACEDQAEIDYYWDKLGEGGEYSQCGWLKDKFGLSWQVVPKGMSDLMAGSDPDAAQKGMAAVLKMSKLEIDVIRAAARGEAPAA